MAANMDSTTPSSPVDTFRREKLLRARSMSADERFAVGPQMFDFAMAVMRDGIRSQFPDLTDEQVEREVDRRLAYGRRKKRRWAATNVR